MNNRDVKFEISPLYTSVLCPVGVGEGILHKFGQGCSFEDIFGPSQKIPGFKFHSPPPPKKKKKITAFLLGSALSDSSNDYC